ncbi:MAG: hypothetical protein NXI28_25205 [bacterium]|jgi:hypothetical protein|nr:hypothetical protein [bacterium]
MTILRLLIFTGLTAFVLAFSTQQFAVGYFCASLLPAVLAAPYVRSLVPSHKIAAVAISFVAMLPIYVSSMGPLNALYAVKSFNGYQTPVFDDAILALYRPLNPLLWSPGFAASFERYLDDWSEIGYSVCLGVGNSEFDPATGLPAAQQSGG